MQTGNYNEGVLILTMKTIAFYLEDGEWIIIGAEELERRQKYDPHTWKSDREYYSTNSEPERRLKMHLKRRGESVYFAFNPGQDDDIKRLGEGETLGHYMYKTAISELKSTTLKLRGKGVDVKINITSAEVEKCIQLTDRKYFIDVFLTFESKSAYRDRWNGQVGIEVHKTNAVDCLKKADMKALDIPIVEVTVFDNFLGYVANNEKSVSNEAVRKQIDWIKERLTKQLWAKVISDPVSDEFSKNENADLKQRLASAQAEISEINNIANTFKNALRDERLRSNKKDEQIEDLRLQIENDQRQAAQMNKKLNNVNQQLKNIENLTPFQFLMLKWFGPKSTKKKTESHDLA